MMLLPRCCHLWTMQSTALYMYGDLQFKLKYVCVLSLCVQLKIKNQEVRGYQEKVQYAVASCACTMYACMHVCFTCTRLMYNITVTDIAIHLLDRCLHVTQIQHNEVTITEFSETVCAHTCTLYIIYGY